MKKWVLEELIDLNILQTMVDNLYSVTGMPIRMLDTKGKTILCTMSQGFYINFQELNPFSSKCYKVIDEKLKKDLNNSDFKAYRYIDNSCEITVPVIGEGAEIATLVFGKFFYEGENANVDFFINQAHEFGFGEDEYVKPLKNISIFSREKVIRIIEYYSTLVITLVESNVAKLKYKQVNGKYSRLLNSIQDFVFVLDSSTKLIEHNKSLDENLYIHVGKFIGKKLNEVLPESIGNALDNALYKVKNGDIIQTINCSVIIDGREMWYSAQVSKLIYDEIGDCDSYIVVTRNITENVNVMNELQNAKLQAEEANTAKNTFVANISHELKTPITVIQSATQLFEMKVKNMEGVDNNYYYNHIRTVKQNCRRLLRLINNLIDVTKVDAGFMRLQLQNLNIVRLVEKLTNSVAEYAKAKRINVTFNKSIKELTVAVDPDKVERILLNLLSNAIKFTEAGGNIIVSIYVTSEDIFISVKDTGIGIPSGKLDMIFERFNNIDNILSRNNEGSGIGLSLAKSFAELHGGKISVESRLGSGSEFTVKLPIIKLNSNQLNEYQNYIVDSNIYSDRINVEFSDIYV